MSGEPAPPADAARAPATTPPARGKWKRGPQHASQWLEKSNQNYLLNLFTALLVVSALIIMLVVGVAINWIYSSAMVKNAEVSAISVVRAIMSAEVDNLLQDAPDGRLMLAVNKGDMDRLDQQMRRYLKFFSMHKINLYTPERTIIYSTDASNIGKIFKDDEDLDRVLSRGEALSKLKRVNDFAEPGGGQIHNAAVVEAYAPIFDADRRLLGIFEVYIDITETRNAIFKVLLLTMSALGAVLSVCLFSLYLLMKRGTLRLIAAHHDLTELATRDYLTGAYNRRCFNDRVQQEFYRMRRQNGIELIKESIGFIMADIDDFKKINDTHGHIAGDEVLREVARRLNEGLRDFDVLCRYGGEEFLIMLPHTDERDAMMVAERLRQRIVNQPVTVEGIGSVPVTVSFGVASSHNWTVSDQAVIALADQALFLAKQGGRNRVILATDPLVVPPPL